MFFPDVGRLSIARSSTGAGNARRQRGFSLHDLLVTLGVSGGLSLGVSSMYPLVRDQQLVAEINQLVGHLSLARSEAIKRGQKAVACPSKDSKQCDAPQDYAWWHHGLLVFIDANDNGRLDSGEPIVRTYSPTENTVRIKSSRSRPHIVYQPNGLASGTTATFTFCDAHGSAAPRYVIVSNTGRARVSTLPPDGKVDEALERCS